MREARASMQVHRTISAYNIAVVLFAALGSIIYGYDSSVIATILGQPLFYKYFGIQSSTTYATQITGACNGLAQAGGFFGCFLSAHVSDRFGRRESLQTAAVLCLIGGAVQAGAQNLATFLTFRFVQGLGVGMCLTTTPLYQSEVAPPQSRGLLVGSHGVFLAAGYNIAGWVGLGSYYASDSSFSWRFPLALQTLFPLILLAGSVKLPPSPRWLVQKDRSEEALRVLQELRACPGDPHHDFAEAEFKQIQSQLQLERQLLREHCRQSHRDPPAKHKPLAFAVLLSHAPYRRRLFLGFSIMFGVQCTGVLVINNYQIVYFAALGVSRGLSLGFYCIYLAVALIGNSLCGPLVDRFGRKRYLLIGLVGCACTLTGECISARYAAEPGASNAVTGSAVFFIFLFAAIFASTIDPNMYIYASEIWPSEVRAVGVAVSISGQWIASILFLQSAPTAFANIGYRFYIVFIVCTVVFGFIVYFWFPETKGLSLEEISGVFGDEVVMNLETSLRSVATREHRLCPSPIAGA